MRDWPHSGFNAFLGQPILPSDTEQRLFTARYLKKCPISNERLAITGEHGSSTVKYTAYRDGTKEDRLFTPLEFLAEIQQHTCLVEALAKTDS